MGRKRITFAARDAAAASELADTEAQRAREFLEA
jgi:hypothetical protein